MTKRSPDERPSCHHMRLGDALEIVSPLVLERSALTRQERDALACRIFRIDRASLIARPEQWVYKQDANRFSVAVTSCARGVPLAHVLGTQPFHEIELTVGPDVLIPRSDTERLVETVLARTDPGPAHILDLGCGSGAIGLALLAARPAWRLCATDASVDACRRTASNAERLRLDARTELRDGSWYEALGGDDVGTPAACFDVIVSNPPYIAEDDPEVEESVVRHEPRQALFSGVDGLDALREVIGGAPAYLRDAGLLAVEHGHRQGAAVRALFDDAGFREIETLPDVAGRDRVTLGVRSARDDSAAEETSAAAVPSAAARGSSPAAAGPAANG